MTERNLMDAVGDLVGRAFPCDCGKVHRIPTRVVETGFKVLPRVGDLVAELLPSGPLLLVADKNTYPAAGEQVVAALGGAREIEVYLLTEDRERLVTEEASVSLVQAHLLEGFTTAVAVGSGTINDIVKLASGRLNIPYGVVATAASMNGYTSSLAALQSGGLKRTVPAEPPVWVAADLDVLAQAPPAMRLAGLGDLLSRSAALSDLKAAHWVTGEDYCPQVAGTLELAEGACRRAASRIGAGDPLAVSILFAALILAGFAMTMASSSAPASGGEHLISHFWDMRRYFQHRTTNLHGAQVAVSSLITASLWELLAQVPKPSGATIATVLRERPSWEQESASVAGAYGPAAELALEEYGRKRVDQDAHLARLERLARTWDDFWADVRATFRPAADIRQVLLEAGAPTTLEEIGSTPEEALEAALTARYMRARYTVLDLASDLGVLEELAPKAIDASGVAG